MTYFFETNLEKTVIAKEHDNKAHKIIISSFEKGSITDPDELCNLEIENGVTGEVYSCSIRAYDEDSLEPAYFYRNNISEIDWDSEGSLKSLVEAAQDYDELSAILTTEEMSLLEQAIEAYSEGGVAFRFEFTPKSHSWEYLRIQEVLVDEMLASLLFKEEKGELTVQDIIEFGMLVGCYSTKDGLEQRDVDYLGFEFQKIVKGVKKNDHTSKYIHQALGFFGLEEALAS